jgi:nucleoside-diphosphate-sugar epimerase
LNLTCPETLSVRQVAHEFGEHFGVEPAFAFEEAPTALLSDATKAHRLLGYPEVSPAEMIEWIANWIQQGGVMLGKPTHFQTRDGKF